MENGKLKGFAVDVVRGIQRSLKRTDPIYMVPRARAYHLALTRPDSALFSTTRLAQREALFKWVGPLYRQQWGFYARKGSRIRIHSMEEARNIGRIGTYRNDAKEQFLQSLGFRNLVSSNNISNVKHLNEGQHRPVGELRFQRALHRTPGRGRPGRHRPGVPLSSGGELHRLFAPDTG